LRVREGVSVQGFTLVRTLMAIIVLGTAATLSVSGLRAFTARAELVGAARVVRGQIGYARALAAARRERVGLELTPGGELILVDSRDSVLRRTRLLGSDGFRLDSARIRPAALRFNPRGQAAAGSVYLHKGNAGLRLVVNFVGRVREERLP